MKTDHHVSLIFELQPSAFSLLFLLLAALPAAQAVDKSFVPTGNPADPSGVGDFSGAASWVNASNNPTAPPTGSDNAYFNRFASQVESTVNFTGNAVSREAVVNKSATFNLGGHTYSVGDRTRIESAADLQVNDGTLETRYLILFPSLLHASMTIAEDATVNVTDTADEFYSVNLWRGAELTVHGSLTIEEGGIAVGIDPGTAQLTISGMSASVRSAGYFELGISDSTSLAGAGKVEVRDGGSLTVSNGTGDAILFVGSEGQGNTLMVNSGGEVVTDVLNVGRFAGASGAVTVSGAGSSLQQTARSPAGMPGFRIGRDGSGKLLVEAGAEVSANASVEIGFTPGSNGAVTVTGTGSTLTTAQIIAVGGAVSETGGAGSLTAADGGRISAGGKVLVWGGGQIVLDDGAIGAVGGFDFRSGAKISGAGILDGNVASKGTLYAPGNSPGRIEITGNWTLDSTDTLLMELVSSAPGEYDSFLVGGEIDLAGTALTLSLLPGFAASPGEVFVLIDNAGTDAFTGQFAGIAEGQSILVDSHLFLASYQGGTGNDFTLTAAVPEPSICALVALGAAVLVLRRKGRVPAWKR